MIGRISAGWARVEVTVAAILAVAITLLILLNVVTRSLNVALYWVDELAIYTMAWMTFLGASAGLHYGQVVAVTVLTDPLPPRLRAVTGTLVDIAVLAFALFMLWFCWRWFAPLDLARAGFDTEAFQGATFNFIYAEPTTTLGLPKFWVWLIMWIFSAGATLHAVANLLGQGPKEPQSS
ncbi:TRAP transporter small permease subunit [Aquicoccus sp. SCR17]|nr:TRAP transporter small permease subunit [Carideicomes alvinocaridis]